MYFYISHMGGIYTSEEELDPDFLYCETCGDSDWLIGKADTFAEGWDLLRHNMFAKDYELGYIHSLLCESFDVKNPFPVLEDRESSDASDEEILREIRYIVGVDQWIERYSPWMMDAEEMPCILLAVNCALNVFEDKTEPPVLKENGYCTLQAANKYIRKYLPVKKRINYKKGSRPKLKELLVFEPAIVCVMGHYLYWNGDGIYKSLFDNTNDDVVTVWILKKEDLF